MDAGYVIVKKFTRLYESYTANKDHYLNGYSQIPYSMPNPHILPSAFAKKYHGIDREGPLPYTDSTDSAEKFLGLLQQQGKATEFFISTADDASNAISQLHPTDHYEIIWARMLTSNSLTPNEYTSIGFEPINGQTGFSPLCDSMCFMRWHGSDPDGHLFKNYYDKLNTYALFNNSKTATDFTNFYLSWDEAEQDNYEIAEIFVKK